MIKYKNRKPSNEYNFYLFELGSILYKNNHLVGKK